MAVQKVTNFVTATVTTPLGKRASRSKHPLPLKEMGHDGGRDSSGQFSGQFGHGNALHHPTKGITHDGISTPSSCVSSNLSMPTTKEVSKQTIVGPEDLKFESNASFPWAPEEVTVQCWHRNLAETYRELHMVGEGRYGSVSTVQHKVSQKLYACKHLWKGDHDGQTLRSEIETLRRLDHPNIVRLCEVIEEGDSIFLLMELCKGGDLYDRINKEDYLPEALSRSFAQQMLTALAFCHVKGVVHRDVKPENFLLETDDPSCQTLKLADFGIATSIRGLKYMNGHDGSEVKGSLPYMAPELFQKRWVSLVKDSNGSTQLLAAGDLWSCGVVIYVMLSGMLPFGDDVTAPELVCRGEPPDFSGEVWLEVSDAAKDLIRQLLNPNSQARLTAQLALQHEWLRGAPPPTATASRGVPAGQVAVLDNKLDGGQRSQLARAALRSLRRWRRLPKLRRIVIACIAQRVEATHPSQRFPQALWHTLNPGREDLRCDHMVQALSSALSESPTTAETSTFSPPVPLVEDDDVAHSPRQLAPETLGDEGVPEVSQEVPTWANAAQEQRGLLQAGDLSDAVRSFASTSSTDSGSSITGFNVRGRLKGAVTGFVRKLSRLSEETPISCSPGWEQTPGTLSADSEDVVSLTELRILVDALDGRGNGTVDYTLLAAAVLPPEVYCDETRIAETFGKFDLKKRSAISPEDLQTSLRTAVKRKDATLRRFIEMVAEFDGNGDGMLDLEEFRSMVQGKNELGDLSVTNTEGVSITPATDEPTPSRWSASPGTTTTAHATASASSALSPAIPPTAGIPSR